MCDRGDRCGFARSGGGRNGKRLAPVWALSRPLFGSPWPPDSPLCRRKLHQKL